MPEGLNVKGGDEVIGLCSHLIFITEQHGRHKYPPLPHIQCIASDHTVIETTRCNRVSTVIPLKSSGNCTYHLL
jgi:hypothetical protein